MTERGLPIVDGAPACPFVAFEDDRDERAASPDHRHRCYAEQVPAPRALAHQEAYCLSSAFPVCPTFQDWARREAARSRSDPGRPIDSVAALAASPTPERNPPRNWAAPPPWLGRGDAGRDQGGLWDEEAPDEVVRADPRIPERGRGLSGSYADRVAGGSGMPPIAHEPVPPDSTGDDAVADDRFEDEGEGEQVAAAPSAMPARGQATYGEPDSWDDEPPGGASEPQFRRRRERHSGGLAGVGAGGGGGSLGGRGGGGGAGGGRGAGGGGGGAGHGGDHRPRRDRDAPEWERSRSMEAYPTLRSRRLSELSVPPLLVGVIALALAAAVLFALPGLLGFGDPAAQASPSPSFPVRTPLITPAPTPVPEPTDQIYIVQSGDTMSRIAGRFEIPLEELIAANAENIPDPNKLQIGDQVIIPARNPDELPAASEIPGAT